jgi:RTX calcium-binding nonapeptide repeat (4 copies)/Animal haem peroxidase
MTGRIKREDLDHLLRLIQDGRLDRLAWIDGEGLPGLPDVLDEEHAVWDANHAFWVESLRADTGGAWTEDEYTAAASIINTAEYQHVVFGDIASALSRGLSSGWPSGGDEVGEERSHPVFSSAHPAVATAFDETFDLVDAATGQVRKVKLSAVFDEVEAPGKPLAQAGSSGAGLQSSAGDAEPVPELPLSRKAVSLGDISGARAREVGHAAFNLARGELFAQCGLSTLLPYSGWDDFSARNQLSEDLIEDLKAAYPDGFGAVDLWVGGLAEQPATGDLGPTLTAAVRAEMMHSHGRNGAPASLEMLAGTQLLAEITTLSWHDIVARVTGEAHLADYVLASTEPYAEESADSIMFGTEGDDVLIGTHGDDVIFAGAGDDFLDGQGGADVLVGGAGNDTYVVDDIQDRVIEAADGGDNDTILTNLDAFALADANDDDASGVSASLSVDDTAVPFAQDATSNAGPATSIQETAAALPEKAVAQPSDAVPEAVTEDAEGTPVADDEPEFGQAANVENLTYTGDGSFIGWGNSSNNVISGGDGDDALWGRGGEDALFGGGGDDALFGGSGDDWLVGGRGDDWLDGGSGDDFLSLSGRYGHGSPCGSDSYGNDTIVLKPGFGNDVVAGFDANDCSDGHDRLDVSAYGSLSADSIGTDIQITAAGPHTIITINEDAITLLDVHANTIGKDDFIFS